MRTEELTVKDIELIVQINKEVDSEEILSHTTRTNEYHFAEVYERFRIIKEGGKNDRVFNRTYNWDALGMPWSSDGSEQGQEKTPVDGRELRASSGKEAKKKIMSNSDDKKYWSMNKTTKFTFGKYAENTVREVMKKDSSYIAWAYYNLEGISFTEDILSSLGVERIRKPGVDEDKFNRWKQKNSK